MGRTMQVMRPAARGDAARRRGVMRPGGAARWYGRASGQLVTSAEVKRAQAKEPKSTA
jgi:hypothetical protein